MEHFATTTNNGSTIIIALGDTLTVTLPYEETLPNQTTWTFGDNFGYNSSLNLLGIAAAGGVRIMDFVATAEGTIDIMLQQFRALGLLIPCNLTSSFKLTVTVR